MDYLKERLVREISSRKKAEEHAKEAQNILLSGIENFVDVLVFSIDNDYRIRIFNSAFKKATFEAYGINISTGMNLFDFITNESDAIKVKKNVDKALAGDSHMTIEEFGDVEKNYFETRYNPIVNDNKIIGATILSTNVTERERSQIRIKVLNAELEAFAYSAAHDLRAPLRTITGFAGKLINEFGLPIDVLRLLRIIDKNANQMSELIDDLLIFAEIDRQAIDKQTVDSQALIDLVIKEEMLHFPNREVRFKFENLQSILCDPKMMKQVFSNLLSNAIKYSGKKISSAITIGSVPLPKEIIFFVKDNGTGFDMKYADKLFDVFQRFHKRSEFEGNGIGLATVKRVIEKHGGRVWAESEESGATFYFSLPANSAVIRDISGTQ
jgi:signal transduction histidine kinase